MSFISYAQNFEDVMLWRAFQHVERGFYIDVGANDPTIDSVTKAFYEVGWHGINLEPLISHHADLVRDRPNDINLICAAGADIGEIELWECDTVIGANQKGAVVTMVERKSGLMAKETNKTSALVSAAIVDKLQPLAARVKTLTFDNGK